VDGIARPAAVLEHGRPRPFSWREDQLDVVEERWSRALVNAMLHSVKHDDVLAPLEPACRQLS
jgi:hypothetical protein